MSHPRKTFSPDSTQPSEYGAITAALTEFFIGDRHPPNCDPAAPLRWMVERRIEAARRELQDLLFKIHTPEGVKHYAHICGRIEVLESMLSDDFFGFGSEWVALAGKHEL